MMAEIIPRNNIQWDRELLKQVRQYKQDGTIPRLANRNFTEIALAVTIETSGKITFSNKAITYEIAPYEDIGGKLDSIMADLVLAVRGQDCLYKYIQVLNLLGISWPSVMEYLNRDMVHQTHQRIWRLKVQKPMIALSKLDQLEVNLIDMSKWAGSNNSRRYVVSIIDCFSKYACQSKFISFKSSCITWPFKALFKYYQSRGLASELERQQTHKAKDHQYWQWQLSLL